MVSLELDGKYHVVIHGQDTERASFPTKEEAFDWYRGMYRFMNGFMKETEHVDDPVFIDKTKWPVVTVNVGESGRYDFMINDKWLKQALNLAAHKTRFKNGHRYEIQVKFREVKETPPFISDGL